MKQFEIRKLVLAALFLAMCILLPKLFHFVGAGTVFLPMHIPVLFCGVICGYKYGGICGALAPLLSSALTGMPPLFPIGISMAFELAVYGIVIGLMYKKTNIIFSLIIAMLCGRIVSGVAQAVFLGVAGKPYGILAFINSSFVVALPGIILQLILIPVVIIILEKSGVLKKLERTA